MREYAPPWSNTLDQIILANLERPTASWQAIAQKIGRTPAAVRCRASMLRARRAAMVGVAELAVERHVLEPCTMRRPGCVDADDLSD